MAIDPHDRKARIEALLGLLPAISAPMNPGNGDSDQRP
jgi:hypothetical protein